MVTITELIDIPGELARKDQCGKSGEKYTDEHGHVGGIRYCCGVITCLDCLPHRINNTTSKFKWMETEQFVYKIMSSLELSTTQQIDDAYSDLHNIKTTIQEQNPKLWFKVAFTGKNIILILKESDKDIINARDISQSEFIHDYVNFTHIKDLELEKQLLIAHKNQRRILGHGKTPKPKPESFCIAIEEKKVKFNVPPVKHALKRKSEIISIEELNTLPKAKYYHSIELMYAIEDFDSNEVKDLDFKTFLEERINGYYIDDWKAYLGKLESKKMTEYLYYLYEHKNEEYKFIENNEHFKAYIDKMEEIKKKKLESLKTSS